MDKKIENISYTLNEEVSFGTVKIADDVIAMIAGMAATEVPGVSAMAGNVGNNLLSLVGYKNLQKGVRVEILDGEVRADLSIIVDYGYNIPSVSAKVQDKVKSTIESMTGLKASTVNIRVSGVKEQ